MTGMLGRFLTMPRLARAPILVQRAGLGWLFGPRLLLLEHTGRRSGAPRFTTLEVVEDQRPHALIVASGFGERAQWYQNLRARPQCHVWHLFARRVPATAELLDEQSSAAMLARYPRAHPRLWARLRSVISEATGQADPRIPLVRLRLGEPAHGE